MKRLASLSTFCLISFCLIALLSNQCEAQLRVANIFSDNMVIQRDHEFYVWGWADAGDVVSVTVNDDEIASAVSDSEGRWYLNMSPMKATSAPFEVIVETNPNSREGSEKITFKNVVCGDVWICSGQSNMEWTVSNAGNPSEEIANGDHPLIRHVKINNQTSTSKKNDVATAGWQVCSPQTVGNFTAVGYYFGRELQQELDIPIGLINTSWGGTIIEAWISGESLKQHPDFGEAVKKIESISTDDGALKKLQAKEQTWQQGFQAALQDRSDKWETVELDDSNWKTIKAPGHWEGQGYQGIDGVAWYRREIQIPATWADKPMTLSLAQIDDADETFVNGIKVGSESAWNANRRYTVPKNLIKPGAMQIAIRVTDGNMGGGIHSNADNMFASVEGEEKISLAGEWKFKLGSKTAALGAKPQAAFSGPNHPTVLYNAMVAPLHPKEYVTSKNAPASVQYNFKGVTWYQGESNAGRAYQYRTLMPLIIKDWRKQWSTEHFKNEFPFYWVQLANFLPASDKPGSSEWAELREAQSMTLALPNTGQAIAIDIGEAADIHPKNKQEVGRRLALNALAKDYGKDIEFSGPVYKSMKVENGKVHLAFDHAKGLNAKGGPLKRFEIAGADEKFVWANAKVEGETVIVSSEQIESPVAVRYAWAHNPEGCNLYNAAGLPASPFRTDDFKGVTQW